MTRGSCKSVSGKSLKVKCQITCFQYRRYENAEFLVNVKVKVVKKFFRSTHRRWSVRKRVLRNSAKFAVKQLWQSVFLIKLQVPACIFINKETLAQVFSCEFCEISENTFTEHLRRLLLSRE